MGSFRIPKIKAIFCAPFVGWVLAMPYLVEWITAGREWWRIYGVEVLIIWAAISILLFARGMALDEDALKRTLSKSEGE